VFVARIYLGVQLLGETKTLLRVPAAQVRRMVLLFRRIQMARPPEDPATCGCPVCDGPAAPAAGLPRGFVLRFVGLDCSEMAARAPGPVVSPSPRQPCAPLCVGGAAPPGSLPAPPSKGGCVRSKAKAMDPEIARNQNYDDHYANDSEDVHSALLPFHDDSAPRARSPYVSAGSGANVTLGTRPLL
jgi:hypothetical protein